MLENGYSLLKPEQSLVQQLVSYGMHVVVVMLLDFITCVFRTIAPELV